MRSVEMKNRCLLYYGNPVGYRTEQGVVADSMFRREELEDWLARKGLAVRWEDGIYDRLSSGGYQKAADNGPALKSTAGETVIDAVLPPDSPEILPYLAARPLSSRRHALHWAGPHEW